MLHAGKLFTYQSETWGNEESGCVHGMPETSQLSVGDDVVDVEDILVLASLIQHVQQDGVRRHLVKEVILEGLAWKLKSKNVKTVKMIYKSILKGQAWEIKAKTCKQSKWHIKAFLKIIEISLRGFEDILQARYSLMGNLSKRTFLIYHYYYYYFYYHHYYYHSNYHFHFTTNMFYYLQGPWITQGLHQVSSGNRTSSWPEVRTWTSQTATPYSAHKTWERENKGRCYRGQ